MQLCVAHASHLDQKNGKLPILAQEGIMADSLNEIKKSAKFEPTLSPFCIIGVLHLEISADWNNGGRISLGHTPVGATRPKVGLA